jgi:hypothetical protein
MDCNSQINLLSIYNDNTGNVAQDTENLVEEDCDLLYNELIVSTTKVLNLLEEQKAAGNIRWIKNVKKNFIPITEMVEEIEKYKRKITMPLTWKGHTNNTRFLN